MIRTRWLERWAMYRPRHTAVRDDATGRDISYGELNDIACRLSRLFGREYGIGRGDRVAVLSQNCIEYLFAYLALQQIGAILVPVNFRLSAPEAAFILSDCAPKLLLYQESYAALLSEIPIRSLPAHRLPMRSASGPSLASWSADRSIDASFAGIDPPFEHPCMILYTSGTTGRPKGAIVTNEMVFWNSVNTTMRLNLTDEDVTLTFAPFFHTGGWHVLTTPFLHRGATIVFLDAFDAARIVELCDEAKVTVLFGVPTMMKMMSDTPQFGRARFDSVRFAIVGGEPMPIPQIELWQGKGVPIRQGYGLTEVGPNCFSLPEEDAIRKKGSIGFPNFYIDTRIVDDRERDVETGMPGELLLRSPVVTPGYWNNPGATAETIREGWFHTGDVVVRDKEGYYFVVDRKKDMFISGAENVYPAEVERVLYGHPAVSEAAVVGVPDEKWGETGAAFLVLKPGAEADAAEMRAFCAGHLAKYKIPMHILFVAELPKGPSGKIQKRELKERWQKP